MTKTLKTRTIVAAVALPILVGIIGLVAVADRTPSLQKLTVGGGQDETSREAGAGDSTASASSTEFSYASVEYVLAGVLPDLPRQAAAYRYRRQDVAARIAGVAGALGLSGAVDQTKGGWSVTDGDLTLVVNDLPGLPWFLSECYYPNQQSPPNQQSRVDGGGIDDGSSGCMAEAKVTLSPDGGDTTPTVEVVPPEAHVATTVPGVEVTVAPPACSTKLADGSIVNCGSDLPLFAEPTSPLQPVRPEWLPDRQGAERIARSVLDRLGASSDGLRVEDGFVSWYAWAPMTVDDLELQMTTSISIGAHGRIIGGNGLADEPERLGDYPLIPVTVGFERLQQGRFLESFSGGRVQSDTARAFAPPPVPATQSPLASLPPAPPSPLAPPDELTAEEADKIPPVDYQPQTIKVTGARVILVQVGDTLVPAYVFEIGDEFGATTPPVAAVVDDLLDVIP